jgi:hypothetical protein
MGIGTIHTNGNGGLKFENRGERFREDEKRSEERSPLEIIGEMENPDLRK